MIFNSAVVYCSEAFTIAEQKSTSQVSEPETSSCFLLALNKKHLKALKCLSAEVKLSPSVCF